MSGKRERYALPISPLIVDAIASRFAVRRSKLMDYLGYISDNGRDRYRRILISVRTTLYMLRRKELIHLVPKVLVVNVPLLLFYHYANGKYIGKTATSLTSWQIGLPYPRAVEIANEVVSRYSRVFDAFISQLLYFRKLRDKLMSTAIKDLAEEIPRIVIRLEGGRVVEIDRDREAVETFYHILESRFYHYLLYILVDDKEKQEEFLDEIRGVFRSFNKHLLQELTDKWKYLRSTIDKLSEDKDPRIRSTARNFLERVLYTCLAL